MNRRRFIAGSAATALSASRLLAAFEAARVELGSIDGSVGANQFTPVQFLDYLASLPLTWAMLSLSPVTLADEAALQAIRGRVERGTPKPATPLAAGKTAGQRRREDLESCVRYTRALLQRL